MPVAQLTKRLPLTLEDPGSNPAIGNFIEHLFAALEAGPCRFFQTQILQKKL